MFCGEFLPNFNGTGSVYVNEAPRYSVALQTLTYTEPIPLNYGKLAAEYSWINGYFFYSVSASRESSLLVFKWLSLSLSFSLSLQDVDARRQ